MVYEQIAYDLRVLSNILFEFKLNLLWRLARIDSVQLTVNLTLFIKKEIGLTIYLIKIIYLLKAK